MSLNTMARVAAAKAEEKPPQDIQDPKTNALTRFIPTESVTAYVALVALQKDLHAWQSWITPSLVYGLVLLVTPVLVFGLFWTKLDASTHLKSVKWPWWSMLAAAIAFAGWGLSVPGNPVGAPPGLAAPITALISVLLTGPSKLIEKRWPERVL